MTLIVDFNMRDEEGTIPALLEPGQQGRVRTGETVVAEDLEGNRCKATVARLSEGPPAVAHLVLVAGTSEFANE